MGAQKQVGRGERDEAGMGLIEVLVAMSLLSILIVMSIAPTMGALANHQRAKLAAIAENLGQARIEEIRSLPYADVGVVDGSPDGVLAATLTRTVQGLDFTVTTTVSFQGSFTGLNVVPQGGDGVQGFWDAGVNYKLARVSVVPARGGLAAVPFETIVAPPNLAAHEGKSNVIVNLSKFEPAGSPSTGWPTVWILRNTDAEMSSSAANSQKFAQVTPGGGTPWVARFGSTLTNVADSATGWRIKKSVLDALTDRVDAPVTSTGTINLTIYKPVTLSVPITDALGAPVPGGTVTVTNGAGATATFDTADPEYTGPGMWNITTFNGEPMPPDTYTLAVNIPGYYPLQRDETVPDSYPTLLADTEGFTVSPIPTGTIQVTSYDRTATAGREIRGATVTISGSALATPITLLTNANGLAQQTALPVGVYSVVVAGTWGHTAVTLSTVTVLASATTAVNAVHTLPAGKAVYELYNNAVTATYGYRTWSLFGSGAYSSIPVNSSGRAALVLTGGTNYDLVKQCSNGTKVAAVSKVTAASGATYTYGQSPAATCAS